MRIQRWFIHGLLFALVALFAVQASARRDRRSAKPEEAMLGKLVNNVRYGLDKTALGFLDGEGQARVLLGPTFDKATPEQRAEFVRLFHHIFAGIAFPNMRDSFQHLTTITYDPPKPNGDGVLVGSVLHVQAGPKEQEIKVIYQLSKAADGAPRVVDVTIVGDKSMLTNIRDDQVQPILSEGGMPKLLELLKTRAAEFKAPADAPTTAKP
jgi:phospholipid transport system substrate-binding protein